MATNLSTITFAILILISSNIAIAANGLLGEKTKVADVESNKAVQEIGRYSVEEYNRLRRSSSTAANDGGGLRFLQVVEAEMQVVAGMKYYLKIEAVNKRSGDPDVFEAVVVVKPWIRSKELLEFAPSKVNLQPVW